MAIEISEYVGKDNIKVTNKRTLKETKEDLKETKEETKKKKDEVTTEGASND